MKERRSEKCIVLVDDESEFIEELSELLSRLPAKLIALTSPVDAIKFALVDVIDILVTDLNMIELDGIKLSKTISMLHPHSTIIIMSGLVPDTTNWDASWRFLRKPFELDALLSYLDTSVIH